MVFISSAAFSQQSYPFKLNVPLDSIGIEYYGDFTVVIGASSTAKGRNMKVGNIEFIVGIDKMCKIVFYSSRDSNFLINNFRYLRYEQNYLDSIKSKSKLFYEIGWAAFIQIGDGWNLAFDYLDIERATSGGYALKKNAKPTYVFKRSNKVNSQYKLQNIGR